jgi:hypothetical protein
VDEALLEAKPGLRRSPPTKAGQQRLINLKLSPTTLTGVAFGDHTTPSQAKPSQEPSKMLRPILLLCTALIAVPASAGSYTFSLDFFDEVDPLQRSGTLSGAFSGTDSNANGRLDSGEFTSFSAAWDETLAPPVLGDFTLGLASLNQQSYFASAKDFALNATQGSFGFISRSALDQTFVGDSFSPGNVATAFAGRALPIAQVPEPAAAALLLAGLIGLHALSRRRRA